MELDFSKRIQDSKELQRNIAEQKSRKQINDLPDSDFAYIEPGGKKVDGKTVPRSLRHLPIMDCDHVRNALARVGQTKISAKAKAEALTKIKAAAKKCGVEVSESEAKDWDKIDKKELKNDDKKEKKEHYKDAVKDDEDHIDKLKKDEKIDKKKEAEAALTPAQKKLPPALQKSILDKQKKDGGGDSKDDEDKDKDKGEDKDSDKEDKKEKSKASNPYATRAPINNIDFQEQYFPLPDGAKKLKNNKADDQDRDERELKQDDKKQKEKHERDAIKDDKDQAKHLKEDEREDKDALKKDEAMMTKKVAMEMDDDKAMMTKKVAMKMEEETAMKMKYAMKIEEDDAMLKMKSRIDEIDKARNAMDVEKAMTQKKLDAMMQKMRASDAP